MLIPKGNKQSFVLLNFGAGHARVSDNNKMSDVATAALYSQWNNAFTFNDLVVLLGAKIVFKPEDADYNFSLDSLQKDSFIKIFEKK